MSTREIKKNIFSVGAIDWDRKMFDELIPLPDGTTYNSYLIRGSEKTALLDSVDPPMADVLMDNLAKTGIKKIDYIISHHGEQDHSGAIFDLIDKFPKSLVVTNGKCRTMLMDLLHIPEKKFKKLTGSLSGKYVLGTSSGACHNRCPPYSFHLSPPVIPIWSLNSLKRFCPSLKAKRIILGPISVVTMSSIPLLSSFIQFSHPPYL